MNNSSQVTYRRSRVGALILGVVALGCAALAAASVSRMLRAKGFTGQEVGAVVVAARDLPAAQALEPGDLRVVDWPRKATPPGAFAAVDALFAGDEVPVPTAGILKGEPVVASRLANTGAGTGLARLLHPAKRAVAIEVDPAVERTGLVFPGAIVDVIITLRDPEKRESSSRIAVQGVRVLTVGARADVATHRRSAEGPLGTSTQRAYLTLEVDPEDAEVIALAQSGGRIDIALRSGEDEAAVETDGVSPGDLTSRVNRGAKAAALAAAARAEDEAAAERAAAREQEEAGDARRKRSAQRSRKSSRRKTARNDARSSSVKETSRKGGGMRLVASE